MAMLDQIRAAREGGHVRRCHGTPHHGEYTVGKHSYDALSILLVAHPDPSAALMKAVLWHDLSERWVGDLPAPVLNAFPELKAQYERAEEEVRRRLGLELPELTEDELRWLKLVDRVEFWLWCKDQLLHGNRHIAAMERRVGELVSDMALPHEHMLRASSLINQVREYAWERSAEL